MAEYCKLVSFKLAVLYAEFRKLALYVKCHYAECCHAKCHYAECRYAKCHYAECHYAECHYAECRYAKCHYGECRGARLTVYNGTAHFRHLYIKVTNISCHRCLFLVLLAKFKYRIENCLCQASLIQPSLMFVGKAGAYPSGIPFSFSPIEKNSWP
jgi:hypothetical protein